MRLYGLVFLIFSICSESRIYYFDSRMGLDTNIGDRVHPFKNLTQIKKLKLLHGDKLLLRRGERFVGAFKLINVKGTKKKPILIGAYGEGTYPLIDSRGYRAAITLWASSYIVIRDLEVVSNGGKAHDETSDRTRYGVLLTKGSSQIKIQNLSIHDIYPTLMLHSVGKTGKTAYGHGIQIYRSKDVVVEKCRIFRTGHFGIQALYSNHLFVSDNNFTDTGATSLQVGQCSQVCIMRNRFLRPGSFIDPRMHGRGDGSWAWKSDHILYDFNRFEGARGKADCCGVHIDVGCKFVTVQRSLSIGNEGGFLEILGGARNNCYRYNISINDGNRTKGIGGALQNGKMIWLSGFRGKKKRRGPYNSYIYNNTIYTDSSLHSQIRIDATAEGVLIANNIFVNRGSIPMILKGETGKNRCFIIRHNLYAVPQNNPLSRMDLDPIVTDPGIVHPQAELLDSLRPRFTSGYAPGGIEPHNLPGDTLGLPGGFSIDRDISGKRIDSKEPFLGALWYHPEKKDQ